MSALPLEEIAARLLEHARNHGATAADVIVAESDALAVGVRLGEVEKVKRSRGKHLGLRIFVGERSAVTSTADFSPGALGEIAADAVALARVTAPDAFAGLAAVSDLSTRVADLDLYDPALERVTPEQALEWCQEAEHAARAADARITNSEGAEFDAGTHRVAYATSHGFTGTYRTSSCGLWAVPVASQNGTMQRDYWYSSQRHLARLEPPAVIGRIAAARALRRLGARQVPTCEVPVVFDPEMAASLLGHLAGAVSGDALYKGTSFLLGKLGEPIAPPFVSVYDDGTLRGALGSKPFDAEGLATRRTPVIDNGRLHSYLFDSYSARKLGHRSTGNAARSVAGSPHVSPTNFALEPGTATPEEIIASVTSGLYVTELMGFGINPVTGDYSRGAAGIWIDHGALAYPVEELTIAGNLLTMFGNIEMVGNDLVRRRSISAPTLKIANLTVAGR